MLKAVKGGLGAAARGDAVARRAVIRSRAVCVGTVVIALAGSMAGGAAAAQPTTPPAPLTPQLQLRALLLRADPHATHLRAVQTTSWVGERLLAGGQAAQAPVPVYLACEKGKAFFPESPPPGVKVRAYPIQCITVLVQNFELVGVALRSHYPDLHTLGSVWKL